MSIGTHIAVLDFGPMEGDARARLGYWIEQAREQRGLSRHELADALSVTYTTIYTWETGRKVPSILMLGPLCDALRVSPELFRDLPEMPTSPVSRYLAASDDETMLEVIRAEREQLRQARSSSKASSTEPRKRR